MHHGCQLGRFRSEDEMYVGRILKKKMGGSEARLGGPIWDRILNEKCPISNLSQGRNPPGKMFVTVPEGGKTCVYYYYLFFHPRGGRGIKTNSKKKKFF